ncbi:MAG: patatin-like phospholipase family protein [Bacteriovoracaceae bacterium]|jgi:NTE family protein
MFSRRIGVALGGGGARGVAHIGILEHFEKINLQIHCLSGTSAGSIIAALYAFGVDLETIKAELRLIDPAPFGSFKLGKLGLFENSEMIAMLKRLLPEDAKLEESPIPLTIKTTDLLTGKGVLLTHGSVIEAVLASTCVPGFYLPQERDGFLLVDGGLTENVPLSGLKFHKANLLIGVNLNGNKNYARPDGILDVVSNAMDIAIDAQTRSQLKEADLSISIDLTQYSRTNSKDFDQLLLEGRKAAEAKVPNLMSLYFWNKFKKIWKLLREMSPIKVPDKVMKVLH